MSKPRPAFQAQRPFSITDTDATTSSLDAWVVQLEPILRHVNFHRFLWGFTLVCAFIAWNRGLLLLYGLVAFLLAVLLVSYGFFWLNLQGVKVQAVINDDNVPAGEPVAISVRVASRFSKHFLQMSLPLTQPLTPTLPQHSPNAPRYSAELFVVYSKGEQAFDCTVQLPRGVYQLSNAQIRCAYPFGILTAQREQHFTPSELYVLPRWFSLASLPIVSAGLLGADNIASRRRGGQDEVTDIRPYRRGDAFKTVHWGASAKQVSRGKDWVVKDFINLEVPSATIVLNQFDVAMVQQHGATVLDNMLSSALAMAQYISRQGYQVRIVGFDNATLDSWVLAVMADMFMEILPNSTQSFTQDSNPRTPQETLPPIAILAPYHADKLRKLAEVQAITPNQTLNYHTAVKNTLAQFPNTSLLVNFFVNTAVSQDFSQSVTTSAPLMSQIQVYFNQQAQPAQVRGSILRYDIPMNATLETVATAFV